MIVKGELQKGVKEELYKLEQKCREWEDKAESIQMGGSGSHNLLKEGGGWEEVEQARQEVKGHL